VEYPFFICGKGEVEKRMRCPRMAGNVLLDFRGYGLAWKKYRKNMGEALIWGNYNKNRCARTQDGVGNSGFIFLSAVR
jgi:hypothetical protein